MPLSISAEVPVAWQPGLSATWLGALLGLGPPKFHYPASSKLLIPYALI
jgi:hypothetical protein